MIRGTTPILQFKLPITIKAEQIKSAQIIIAYSSGMKRIIIEKKYPDGGCSINNNIVLTKLTQDETLSLPESNNVEVQLRIKLEDNTVLATKPYQIEVYKLLKEGVLE